MNEQNQTINTIYQKLYLQAEKQPDAPAIYAQSTICSFKQLVERAAAYAAVLPEDAKRVGVVTDHGIDQIALLVAILKNGGAYIPAEPSFPDRRIITMLKDGSADLLITDQNPDRFLNSHIPVLSLSELKEKLSSLKTEEKADPSVWKEKPDDLAYILYTSGTTGRPKGVMISSANVCHYARAFEAEFEIGPGDIMLQYSLCTFDIFTEEVFASLLNGAAIAIPDEKQKETIESLMDFVEEKGITFISGFPYLLDQLNKLDSIPKSLRILISGGDVLREVYVDRLRKIVPVYNTYGPSETTVCAAYCNCSENEPLEDGTFPIGHPVLETQIRLLDEAGHPVEDGKPGEICIFGQGVGQGYAGHHPVENKAFTTWSDGSRMYRSGDIGLRLPDGQLAFLHRKDDQVMILGRRVEPAEVENVLSSVPGIGDAAVRAFYDPSDLAYLIGYIILDDPNVTFDDIRTMMAASLPSYMIPEFFVSMQAFPYNDHGKIDTGRLPVVLKEGYEEGNKNA